MKTDSRAEPTGKRIAGTLHLRGTTSPAPHKGEGFPREQPATGELAGRHQGNGQKDGRELQRQD
jgi:hypothetical protein